MTLPALLVLLAAGAEPLAEGQRLLDAGNFEAALARFEAAVTTERAPAQLARLHLARARCLAALRRNAAIETAMEAALEADPAVSVGEAGVSPSFRATFDRVRARLGAELTVDTEPIGATVKLDGALLGRAPVKQLVPVGKYRVTVIDAQGADAVSKDIVVAPRQRQAIVLQLPVAAAPVAVQPPSPAPVAPPAAEAPAPAERTPWPVEPALAVRVVADVPGGVSKGIALEAGAAVLGRYWLVEVAGLIAASAGVGLRAGGRLPLAGGLLGLQLTLDGAAIFTSSPAIGGGATASFVVHPLAALDVLVDVGARFMSAPAEFRAAYFLAGLTLRLRIPTGLDG